MLPNIVLVAVIVALTACSAPPPARTEVEKRRPPRDEKTLDALVVDRAENATWLIDLRIRGAAAVFEDDDWDFIELDVPGFPDPQVYTFRAIRSIEVGAIAGDRLNITVIPREGQPLTGTLRRRARLEGSTDFGPMSISLREISLISFGGQRDAKPSELKGREERKR